MKIKEIETTKKEKQYIFTEAELNILLEKQYVRGQDAIINYMKFCIKNYPYQMNFSGAMNLTKDIIDFVKHRDIIPNTYNLSFEKWMYDKERLW